LEQELERKSTATTRGELQVAKRWKPIWRQRLIIATLVLSDLLLALAIWGAAYLVQGIWNQETPLGIAAIADVPTIVPTIAVWIGIRALLGLYPAYGLDSTERLRRHTYSVFTALAIVTIFAAGFRVADLPSRALLFMAFAGLLFTTPFVQYSARWGMRRIGLWGKPVIVLSYKETGEQFLRLLEREWGQGYDPIALFDYNLMSAGAYFEETPYEKTLADAIAVAREQGVDTIFLAIPYTRREQLARMVSVASESFRHVLLVPNLSGVTNSAVAARDFAGTFAVEIKHNLLDPWAQRLKRALDMFGAAVGGLLISPLMVAIAVLIKLDSQGPVFYGHQRLGAGSKKFLCWKFRTMRKDAERLLDEHLQNDPNLQAEWEQNHKLRNDPRVTRVGHFLRKTSLDELPQLWNVLWGEMSLIGPRPIVEAEVSKYEKAYKLYIRIKPGMSGFWQVSGRSDTGYDERVYMDSYYVRNWSIWLDIVLLARTVKTVLLGRGAY
jgi:Undecaprenyl-phosphate galactose phosphotransferase WbaP